MYTVYRCSRAFFCTPDLDISQSLIIDCLIAYHYHITNCSSVQVQAAKGNPMELKYYPSLPCWLKAYFMVHFLFLLCIYMFVPFLAVTLYHFIFSIKILSVHIKSQQNPPAAPTLGWSIATALSRGIGRTSVWSSRSTSTRCKHFSPSSRKSGLF